VLLREPGGLFHLHRSGEALAYLLNLPVISSLQVDATLLDRGLCPPHLLAYRYVPTFDLLPLASWRATGPLVIYGRLQDPAILRYLRVEEQANMVASPFYHRVLADDEELYAGEDSIEAWEKLLEAARLGPPRILHLFTVNLPTPSERQSVSEGPGGEQQGGISTLRSEQPSDGGAQL
jgi:hypothetical protein